MKVKIHFEVVKIYLTYYSSNNWKAIILSSQWKNKDICDYDPRCIMSSGLMFDEIIMGHIQRNVLSHHTAENDCVFTQIVSHIIYIYRVSLQYFYCKKGTYECIETPCEHFWLKRNKVKYYWTCVLINDTTSDDMDELVDNCLVSFEKFHKKYIIMPSLSFNPLLIEESLFVTVWSPPGSLIKKMKQDVI